MWKHDHYELLRLLYERLNRLLEDSLARHQNTIELNHGVEEGWEPAVDIYEANDHYLIMVEISGLHLNSMKLRCQRGRLTIQGVRAIPENDEDEHHRMEIASGKFIRSVPLPADASTRGIQYRYEDGVLTVTIPRKKRASRSPRNKPSSK